MQVHRLSSRFHPFQDLSQAPQVVHTQDIDVVLAAESLDQGEMDLKGHVLDIVLVCGQQTQDHIVWISEEQTVWEQNC